MRVPGGTPPMAKPVRLRTNSASALPTGSCRAAARRSRSTRFAPEDITRTARSLAFARNTRELAICATEQPRKSDAACAVRAAPGSSTIPVATPARSSTERTRSTLGLVRTAEV